MTKHWPFLVLLAFVAGIGAGYWYTRFHLAEKATVAERRPLYYRDPMNPAITSPVPKQDEMGMDYVPVYAEEIKGKSSAPAGTVRIDSVTMQDIGVRTARVEQRSLARTIRTVGLVTYSEQLLARLHPKIEGWITRLYVDETGEHVKRNQELLQIYSPQLVATEEEYVLALNSLEVLKNSPYKDVRQGAENLVRSTRERLAWLDVPPHQIRQLEKTREIEKNLHIHSPFDGIVVNIGAREGAYVTPQTEIYMIASLAKVWVYVEVYEYEIPWVKLGDEAVMTLAGLPGQAFKGRITYVYPYLESKTRTLRVRLEFDNPKRALKPEMFANVTILASRRIDTLVVPEEAVVDTGISDRVFVVRAPGEFEPRLVKVGVRAEGYAQILDGVKAGEEVVTSSEFLIDSESKLREAAELMVEPHGGHQAGQKNHALEHGGHQP
jgi:Cu(I)/Ag(I) efflux system membrane fusion protein